MLEAIRKRSASILVKLLLGLLILSFAAWGISDVFQGGASATTVAEVGDTEIGPNALNAEVQQELYRLRQALGGQIDESRFRGAGLAGVVLNRMIDRTLIGLGASGLGIAIDDALVSAEIRRTDAFKNELGHFDRIRFEQVIRSNGWSESQYVGMLRGDMARAQYVESLGAGGPAPAGLVDALFRHRQERRVADVVAFDDAAMAPPADPGVEVLAAFHQDNAARYTAPEYRSLTVLRLEAADLVAEMSVAEEEARKAFEDRAGEFRKPERRRVEQILLASEDDAKTAHQRLSAGEDFATVAKDVAGMEADATKLGVVTQADLLPEVAEPAFGLSIGAASAPVSSPLGWHILRVTMIEPGSEPTFADVRGEIEASIRNDKVIDALYELSNRVEDTLGGGATLEETAKALNLKLVKIETVTAAGQDGAGKAVADLPAAKAFLETAFSTAEGNDSGLVEAGPDGYFILRVDSITPPTLRSLDGVRNAVLADWTAEQQAGAAKVAAEEMKGKVAGGADLTAVANAANLAVKRTEPFLRTVEGATDVLSPDVASLLFQAKVGDVVAGPGAKGWQVARLVSVKAADPATGKDMTDAMKKQLSAAMRSDLLAQLSEGLRARHPVSINGRALERMYADQ